MKLSSERSAQLVELVAQRARRARVTITGASMEPLLRAGMVVDIEPISAPPRIGDILVFRSQTGLVAHRLIGGERLARSAGDSVVVDRLVDDETGAFLTSGDAVAQHTERVPRSLVVGRVCAVWTSGESDARRVDDERYERAGTALARAQALRSIIARGRAYGRWFVSLVIDPVSAPEPALTFARLVTATRCFEQRQYAAGIAELRAAAPAALLETARRHHLGGVISEWFAQAERAGIAVPVELHDPFRRLRWTNVLQAGRVMTCARDVHDRFRAAGIPHMFLKGAARLASGVPGADVQFAGDVDVIVPAPLADRAMAALRDAGYLDVQTAAWRASHAPWMHHREPLTLPPCNVPVEVHVTLAPRSLVSARLDYAALAPSSRRVAGPIGAVEILDDVGAAVHLAYHARDLHVWRDCVLLSRLLAGFDRSARSRFDAFVRAERRDGLRLRSVVAAADAIAFGAVRRPRCIENYLAWVAVREDLPRRLGSPDIVEARIGRCPMPKLQLHGRADVARWAKCWIRNVLLLPRLARR